MAVDKLVDSALLDASCAYEAGKIRAKLGSSAQIAFDLANGKGFGDAIEAIPTGGGGISIDDIATGAEPSGDIVLSDSVTTIGAYAFFRSKITSISGKGVTTVNGNAFDYANLLARIDLPNLTTKDGDYHFRGTAITEFINEKSLGVTSFNSCPNLKRIVLMGANSFSANFWISNCPSLEEVIVPNATTFSPNGNGFNNDVSLKLIDAGKTGSLYGAGLPATAPLSIIILRKNNGLVTLSTPNGFNSAAFAQGGTGGEIYIPETLYNHLGDGTSLDYTIQTNWATFLAKGTTTWKKIEGSPYESVNWWKTT